MKPFTVVTSPAAALMLDNIDTDVIVRIERIARLRRGEFAPWAFEALRYRPDGSEDPDFVLNRAPWRQARILVSGANFGCGSSREMAVWAVAGLGIRCVIAPSFGEIFLGNCFQNGVLPIRLPAAAVQRLQERLAEATAQPPQRATLTVDLHRQRIATPWGEAIAFEVEALRRAALLQGLDAIGVTLGKSAAIDAFQARQRAERPWVWQA